MFYQSFRLAIKSLYDEFWSKRERKRSDSLGIKINL